MWVGVGPLTCCVVCSMRPRTSIRTTCPADAPPAGIHTRCSCAKVKEGLEGATIVALASGDCQTIALDISGRVYGWGCYKDKVGFGSMP